MDSPIRLLPGSVAEMLASVSESGCLTEGDRYGLMAAVFDETLDEDERRAINRLLRSVIKGQIKLIDESTRPCFNQ